MKFKIEQKIDILIDHNMIQKHIIKNLNNLRYCVELNNRIRKNNRRLNKNDLTEKEMEQEK
jgi:hypothetical protein